jgi:hypothetical protein
MPKREINIKKMKMNCLKKNSIAKNVNRKIPDFYI